MRLDWENYIVTDPNIMLGKPVFAGTRLPIDLIFEKIGAGESFEQILEAHPRLTRQALMAAFSFASDWMRAEVSFAVSQPA